MDFGRLFSSGFNAKNVLINSVQEQQVIIESQNAEIDAIKVQMTQMQKTLDVLTNK